jgi:6-phosphofructokinase 2
MRPIVTLTVNPAVDESSSVDCVTPGSKLRCSAPRYEPGGGGLNVARAIVRLGGEAIALYAAGGPSGRLLGDLLDAERVPRLEVPISEWTRRNLNVREDATERQFRFVFPGPTLKEEEWRQCLDSLRKLRPSPEFIVASGSLSPGVPLDFYARVAAIAKETEARFVLDSSGEPLRRALEKGVFLFKPSLREFQQVIGREVCDDVELAEAARSLIRAGRCATVVVSLGERGALWVTRSEQERVPAPAVPVASVVGAGDALLAGIVLSLARAGSLRESVLFGVAAAAATVMNPGTELCSREDAERLLDRLRAVPA